MNHVLMKYASKQCQANICMFKAMKCEDLLILFFALLYNCKSNILDCEPSVEQKKHTKDFLCCEEDGFVRSHDQVHVFVSGPHVFCGSDQSVSFRNYLKQQARFKQKFIWLLKRLA